jgi:hypothetical protein
MLEAELIRLRAFATSRRDVALPQLLDYARQREREAARRFDAVIVDAVIVRTGTYFNLLDEASYRVCSTPTLSNSTCASCAALANEMLITDYVIPSIRRTVSTCAFCGVFANLPEGPLHLRILSESLVLRDGVLMGRALFSNRGQRLRTAQLGAAIALGGELDPSSIARAELVVDAGGAASFDFRLKPVKPPSGSLQTRVFFASEGAFGIVSRFVQYGRLGRTAADGMSA